MEFEGIWAERRIPVKKAKPGEHEWATYIQDRSPKFKVHRTQGHARAAMGWRFGYNGATADMALYEKNGDDWVVQLEVYKGDRRSVLPWLEPEPTPEERAAQRREDEWNRIKTHIATFIGSAEDGEFEERLDNARRHLNKIADTRGLS